MNFLRSFQHKGTYTLSFSFAVDFRSMKGIGNTVGVAMIYLLRRCDIRLATSDIPSSTE